MNYAFDLFGKHKTPDDDSGMQEAWYSLVWKAHYKFGFKDHAQYRSWFYSDEFLAAAIERKFVLSVYSVPIESVIIGYTQVVYDTRFAVKVGSFDLLESPESLKKALDAHAN